MQFGVRILKCPTHACGAQIKTCSNSVTLWLRQLVTIVRIACDVYTIRIEAGAFTLWSLFYQILRSPKFNSF